MSLEIPGLRSESASTDKLVRSMAVSKLWNQGKVLVPSKNSIYYGPWVEDFCRVVEGFTGVNDKEDDDVDALSALEMALDSPSLRDAADNDSGRRSGDRYGSEARGF
jgi:predicted phage terminase large subunit-like protein